ncbi:hypothetical protein HDK77DRAFT_27035 [Phyllosticta capitalensis]
MGKSRGILFPRNGGWMLLTASSLHASHRQRSLRASTSYIKSQKILTRGNTAAVIYSLRLSLVGLARRLGYSSLLLFEQDLLAFQPSPTHFPFPHPLLPFICLFVLFVCMYASSAALARMARSWSSPTSPSAPRYLLGGVAWRWRGAVAPTSLQSSRHGSFEHCCFFFFFLPLL